MSFVSFSSETKRHWNDIDPTLLLLTGSFEVNIPIWVTNVNNCLCFFYRWRSHKIALRRSIYDIYYNDVHISLNSFILKLMKVLPGAFYACLSWLVFLIIVAYTLTILILIIGKVLDLSWLLLFWI